MNRDDSASSFGSFATKFVVNANKHDKKHNASYVEEPQGGRNHLAGDITLFGNVRQADEVDSLDHNRLGSEFLTKFLWWKRAQTQLSDSSCLVFQRKQPQLFAAR